MKLKLLLAAAAALALNTAVMADSVYTIYPVPHSQTALKGTASFTSRVNIVVDPSVDDVTIARAEQILNEKGLETKVRSVADSKLSNLYLGVAGSNGMADRYASRIKVNRKALAVKDKYDRHVLVLTERSSHADVLILGENTDATFCGLASLEQMLDNGTGDLPCVRIEDYADIRYRGVIEGYYGVPYSAEVTKDLFRFMARYKMNSYMYGAKSDPYHSQKWDEAYPDSITVEQKAIGYLTSDMMRDMVSVSHECKVNFIWAIHPGKAFTDPDDNVVIDRIMSKFDIMYDLGVRQFGVFVDDIGVPNDQPTLDLNARRISEVQERIEARWNVRGASPADTVKPVNFVPQLYAHGWADAEKRARFFNALGKSHPSVIVYITGAAVWTVPNSEDLAIVSHDLGRNLAWWWNYPCNDNDMTKLFVRDTYANFDDEKWIDDDARLPKALNGASALISNPMQQGEAAKIALFGVGDFSWNNAAFDNESDFKAAVKATVGKAKAADFEYLTNYLRYYDSEPVASLVDAYKNTGDSAPLKAEMTKMLQACQSIEAMEESGNESDCLFVDDIRPWLNSLGDMAYLTLEMLDAIDAKASGPLSPRQAATALKLKKAVHEFDNDESYTFNVFHGMGDDIRLSQRTAEPSAVVLRPFLDYLADRL
ncbi:MAG: beta-N-acetylglucosaminidase domain-containing protein [Bacteroidales bacterium]|nr:beta-N-acetylglucosaminidase domain-containing protein [Bacteroidales bacterium]